MLQASGITFAVSLFCLSFGLVLVLGTFVYATISLEAENAPILTFTSIGMLAFGSIVIALSFYLKSLEQKVVKPKPVGSAGGV